MVGRVIITFVNLYFMCFFFFFLMYWEQYGGLHCPLKLAERFSSFHSAYILPDLSHQPRPSHELMAIKACKNCCESNKMSHDLMTNYDVCPTSSEVMSKFHDYEIMTSCITLMINANTRRAWPPLMLISFLLHWIMPCIHIYTYIHLTRLH